MGYCASMASRLVLPVKCVAVTVLATGLLASGMSASNSATPTPRVSEAQCSTIANNSGGTGYVIVDTTTNTSCVVKANGTFVFSSKAKVCENKPVKFQGSLLPTNRGDMVVKMKVRYIRGNKVIKKWIKVRPGRSFATKQKFKGKGTWTAVFSYKGKVVTTKVKVQSC